MFRGLFKKHEDDDEIFEIDPVVEQRRKEKFSTPLIYDEEFKSENEETAATPKVKTKTKAVETKVKVEEKPRQVYQMSEVISPMRGITKNKTETKLEKPSVSAKPKKRKNVDQLVPVISPFYGTYETKESVESAVSLKNINDEVKEKQNNDDLPTVEDNLRNIAKIVEEEQNQLKIIEERTGEFKLDFGTSDVETQSTLIDEIDDDMSLDELMSLYEKKFKD